MNINECEYCEALFRCKFIHRKESLLVITQFKTQKKFSFNSIPISVVVFVEEYLDYIYCCNQLRNATICLCTSDSSMIKLLIIITLAVVASISNEMKEL